MKSFSQVDIRQLHYVMVTCPIDEGPMHLLDGQAMRPERVTRGPHMAESLRSEFDAYDTSSSAYKGDYQISLAEEIEEFPDAPSYLFISGSWSNFQMERVEQDDQSEQPTYSFHVVLGDTRCEKFFASIDKDGDFRIYPYVNHGSVRTRVYGPDVLGKGRHWLIDGRQARVPAGSTYKVCLRWGKSMSVSWKLVEGRCASSELEERRDMQAYHVKGTFTSWTAREMSRVPDEPGTYAMTFKASGGRERFQLLCDGDDSCMIYPSKNVINPQIRSSAVPVRGPDELGHGKYFTAVASAGEIVKVRLRVIDAAILVEVSAPSDNSVKIWRSKDGPERHDFFVYGSFTDWLPAQLTVDPENCNVYRFQGVTQYNSKEFFNIVVDEDTKCAMYPEVAGSQPGTSIVRGPDAQGVESWFVINCWMPGVPFEIVLDIDAVDKRKKVTLDWLAAPIDATTMRAVVAQSLIGEEGL